MVDGRITWNYLMTKQLVKRPYYTNITFDGTIEEVIQQLQDYQTDNPDKVFYIDSYYCSNDDYYGEGRYRHDLLEERLETDEEERMREEKAAKWAEARRSEYERLKKEFEGK